MGRGCGGCDVGESLWYPSKSASSYLSQLLVDSTPIGRVELSMLKTFVTSAAVVGAAVPGLIATLLGLMQAAKFTEFDKANPEPYAKLVAFANTLLWLLIEHWVGYLILVAGLATYWTLFVAEPKRESKISFDRQRNERLKKK